MLPLSPHRILVAEDERAVRMLLRVVLEAAGATVVEAEHGGQALRMLELGEPFDLVITDLNMPELDGLDLARQVRTRWRHMPLLLCTAMEPTTRTEEAAHLFAAVLPKPFAPQDLVRAAADAVAEAAVQRNEPSRATAV